jgi:hypothetical protein
MQPVMRGNPAKGSAPLRRQRPHLNGQRYSTIKFGTSVIGFALSAILVGAASRVAPAQAVSTEVATATGKVWASEIVKMTATVVSIDMGSRDVLLRFAGERCLRTRFQVNKWRSICS